MAILQQKQKFDTEVHFAQDISMLNKMKYSLPEGLRNKLRTELEAWRSADKTARIWAKDTSVWTGDDEAKWLGWLTIVAEELADSQKYHDLRNDIEAAGYSDILLMGMGGSSLCPEVLALTFGRSNFHILDSTVPAQVKTVEDKLDLEKTLFIVASKSGSTLEPNCFKQYFFDRVAEKAGREHAGKQFIAITDPGSKMAEVAKDDGFRHIFYGKPEIGGRFSALSAFGMTAAASMGLDTEGFLKSASEMVDECRNADPEANPGAILGLILGLCHKHGRDKLTIFTTPEIHDLGAWLEQLVAESTGKRGVAIIPVDREPVQSPVRSSNFSWTSAGEEPPKGATPNFYGSDRIFVFLTVAGNDTLDEQYAAVAATKNPAVRIELDSIDDLGQEFFRWEFATAVVGSAMKINPFNQPDVESAKIESRKITEEYEKTGSLPDEHPFYEDNGVSLFSSDAYAETLRASAAEDSLRGFLDAHIRQIVRNDYFALLAYVEMNSQNEELLSSIREKVLQRSGVATCLGFGPRFLHSTGQAYKGGPNNGVVLQITSDDAFDLPVPGQKYTFGVVKAAQARGDFQVLLDRGRRALRLHIGDDVSEGLRKIASII